MIDRRLVALLAIGFALVGAAAPPPKHKGPPIISIVINGETLPIDPPPRFEGNVLMVPVRRTIEALGLDFERAGPRVITHVGAKTVVLTVDSRSAQIDGSTVELDAAPTEDQDVLYAPLRFFTAVLGAQAHYDSRAHAVTIAASLVGRSGEGVVSNGDHVERSGTVTAVDLNSNPPTVTLAYNASVKTIPITQNALVDIQDVDAHVSMPGELSDVRPGDFARIVMHRNGNVDEVIDAYGSHSGQIAAVDATEFLFDDGHVIKPGRIAQISINGTPATITDVRVGDRATVRYNVETNEVREVLVSRTVTGSPPPAAPGAPAISSVQIDATRPLRAGETFTVTVRGTPGGSASFDLGPYQQGIVLVERDAGVYIARYTVTRGANYSDVPIIGHLRKNGLDAAPVQAAQTVSAASSPPGIVDFAPDDGSVVNTSKPSIYATFASDAVDVNPDSISLSINGRDVTSEVVRTAQSVEYMPSYTYPNGRMHVMVRVSDRAGNTTIKSWTFDIKAR